MARRSQASLPALVVALLAFAAAACTGDVPSGGEIRAEGSANGVAGDDAAAGAAGAHDPSDDWLASFPTAVDLYFGVGGALEGSGFEWPQGQAEVRRAVEERRMALRTLLELDPAPSPLAPRVLRADVVVHDGVSLQRELLVARMPDGYISAACRVAPVGAPEGSGDLAPLPAVLFHHGHGQRPGAVGCGYAEPLGDDAYLGAAALDLAAAGSVVIAPWVRSFRGGDGRLGHHRWLRARMLTPDDPAPMATYVDDGRRWLGVLLAHPRADRERVRAAGVSLGGLITILVAALERDVIDAALVNGFVGGWRSELFRRAHCPCVYPPGLLDVGEWWDLAALIAPRPLLLVAGRDDEQFSLEGAQRAFVRLQAIYDATGAGAMTSLGVHPGHHEWESGAGRSLVAIP